MKREIWVKELVESLNESYRILGRTDRYVSIPSPIEQAGKKSLSWCSKNKRKESVTNSKAGVIICPDNMEFSKQDYRGKTLIQVSTPRLTFIKILQKYFLSGKEFGIHRTAIIDEKAKIYGLVYVGPHSYIGECEIGEGTIIHGNVHIYSGTRIGKRVTIHAGTVIGADGFGFERDEKGKLEKFPQIGGLIIEDDVEIGSNVSIDRGTLEDTVIGAGTKIGDLVQIAHNVVIGRYCIIIAQSTIGGSTKIGDYCYIAPGAIINNGLNVGSNVKVCMGSVVTRDIEDDCVVFGIPARVVRKQHGLGNDERD